MQQDADLPGHVCSVTCSCVFACALHTVYLLLVIRNTTVQEPHAKQLPNSVQDNFLPWFAQCGRHVLAVSLRGHGQSCDRQAGDDKYKQSLEDLAHVISSLPEAPVLVAHSMGGFFAQR